MKTLVDTRTEIAITRDKLIEEVKMTDSMFLMIPVKSRPNNSILISAQDYEMVKGFNWTITASGYPTRRVPGDQSGKKVYLHKEVFGSSAKHINGNRLDCRRQNLIASFPNRHVSNRLFPREDRKGDGQRHQGPNDGR